MNSTTKSSVLPPKFSFSRKALQPFSPEDEADVLAALKLKPRKSFSKKSNSVSAVIHSSKSMEDIMTDVEQKLKAVESNLGGDLSTFVTEPTEAQTEPSVRSGSRYGERKVVNFQKPRRHPSIPADIAVIPLPTFKRLSLSDELEVSSEKTTVLPTPQNKRFNLTRVYGSMPEIGADVEGAEERRYQSLDSVAFRKERRRPSVQLTRAAELRAQVTKDRLKQLDELPRRMSSNSSTSNSSSLSGYGSQRPLKKKVEKESEPEVLPPAKPVIDFFNTYAPLIENRPKTEPVYKSSEEVFLEYNKSDRFS